MIGTILIWGLVAIGVILPVVVAIRWWKWSAQRPWMHLLLAPALAAFHYLLIISLYFGLMWQYGRLEGLDLLQLPPLVVSVLSGTIYYIALCFKILRDLWTSSRARPS
jgi:hypothetical protein